MSRFKKATCKWCHAEIFWMPHERTGKNAPLDWYPVPGGNIRADLDKGVYEVLAGDERTMADATVLDPDANPNLYMNHWSTCTSSRAQARRGARPPQDVPHAGKDLAAGTDQW